MAGDTRAATRDTEAATLLYRDPDVSVVDLDCHAHGPDATVRRLDVDAIAFVRSGFFEVENERGRYAVQANHAVCFERSAPHRVHHPVGVGDRCTIVGVARETLEDLLTHVDPGALDAASGPFSESRRRCSSTTAMAQMALVTDLKSDPHRPGIEVVERAMALVAGVLAAEPDAVRSHGRREWRDVATAAEQILAARYAERLSLAEVARGVGVSSFHLSRVFRAMTGTTVHRYLLDLRLRASLEPIAAGEADLSALALGLGFSDASHFSNAFREAFGVPPSVFRTRHSRKNFQARAARRPYIRSS